MSKYQKLLHQIDTLITNISIQLQYSKSDILIFKHLEKLLHSDKLSEALEIIHFKPNIPPRYMQKAFTRLAYFFSYKYRNNEMFSYFASSNQDFLQKHQQEFYDLLSIIDSSPFMRKNFFQVILTNEGLFHNIFKKTDNYLCDLDSHILGEYNSKNEFPFNIQSKKILTSHKKVISLFFNTIDDFFKDPKKFKYPCITPGLAYYYFYSNPQRNQESCIKKIKLDKFFHSTKENSERIYYLRQWFKNNIQQKTPLLENHKNIMNSLKKDTFPAYTSNISEFSKIIEISKLSLKSKILFNQCLVTIKNLESIDNKNVISYISNINLELFNLYENYLELENIDLNSEVSLDIHLLNILKTLEKIVEECSLNNIKSLQNNLKYHQNVVT